MTCCTLLGKLRQRYRVIDMQFGVCPRRPGRYDPNDELRLEAQHQNKAIRAFLSMTVMPSPTLGPSIMLGILSVAVRLESADFQRSGRSKTGA